MNLGLPSGLRWFQALLLVSQVAGATVASEGRGQDSSSRDLNHVEEATILNLQTNLRRDLIKSLVDIRSKKAEFEGLHSVVDEIIQGLRNREVDPFDLFGDGENAGDQSRASQLEKIIWNLQGKKGCAWDLSEWSSSAHLPSFLTVAGPTPEQLRIVKEAGESFVLTVLAKIGEGSLMLDKDLLRDILYNFRFKEYSADLEMFAENVNHIVGERPLDFSDFDANSLKKPDEVFSAILRYVLLNLRFVPGLRYQIDRLLSALQETTNVARLNETAEEDEEWRLFDLIFADDYPPDVVRGKTALSRLLRGRKRTGDLEGRPPGERLLMLVAGLTSVSEEAKVAYPHLKLRLLTSEGKFFRPRGASDVAFLLDSFLTAHPEITPALLREVDAAFSSSDFDWKEVLKNFDYSRYSRPRTLFLDMVQRLLDNSAKLPVCGKIVLGYFMRINRRIESSAFVHLNNDVFVGQTENPYMGTLSDVPTPKAVDTATFFVSPSVSIDRARQRFPATYSSLFIATSGSSLDQSTATSPPATTETSEVFASRASSPLQHSAATVTSERLLVTEKSTSARPASFSPLMSTASGHSEPFLPTSSTYSNPEQNSASSSPLGDGRTEMFWSSSSNGTTLSVSQAVDSEDLTLSSAMYPMTSTEEEIVSPSDHNSPDGV